MKKMILAVATAWAFAGMWNLSAVADETQESVNVYVTISDDTGKTVVTQEKILVTDIDADGALTINDALYIAHEEKYEGGASAGFTSYYSDYGISMSKLWGAENGGCYAYYVNHKSASSLADTVKEGDYVNAFVYTDLVAWSDKYTFFDKNQLTTVEGDEIVLTLLAAGYDAEYKPITIPVANATVTIDGVASEYKTNEEGKVTIVFDNEGNYVVSATSDTDTLVPPVCVVSVDEKKTQETTTIEETTTVQETTTGKSSSVPTGDDSNKIAYFALVIVFSILSVLAIMMSKRVDNEK